MMNTTFHIEKDQEQYITLTESHYVPLFFQAHWLDMITDQSWEGWVIYNHLKEVIGVISLPYQKKGPLKTFRNPIFHPYSGPYFFDSEWNLITNQKKIWELIFLQDKSYQFWMQLHGSPQYKVLVDTEEIVLDEIPNGTTFSSRITHTLSLVQDEEALFNSIRSRRRSYLRRAQKSLTVQELNIGDWTTWLEWLAISFEKKGDYMPYTPAFLEKIHQTIHAIGNHSLLLEVTNQLNETIAVLWVLYDEHTAYQMWSTFHPEKSENGCMDLLIWEAWMILKEKGVKKYDFEGSMNPGIARFFKHMGGEPREYLSVTPPTHKIITWLKKIKK